MTSIGGLPVFLDEWKVDACYAGGQKCLSCPPGLAPLTFRYDPRLIVCLNMHSRDTAHSERAMAKLQSRKSKVANWYLDMNMIAAYLSVPTGAPRTYHHTVCANPSKAQCVWHVYVLCTTHVCGRVTVKVSL